MSRLSSYFESAKKTGRKTFVAYIVNGDPTRDATLPVLHKMVEAGVDVIEIGIPFSDPMAEGPVIQKAHERALLGNISLKDTLDLVAQFRQTNTETPIVLMGYANPVERMGYPVFADAAAAAGVDGLLTVDLPLEEVGELRQELDRVSIDNIFLLAPTTKSDRAQQVAQQASGFLYYVSLRGVTGAGHLDLTEVQEKVGQFRKMTDLPICVGFGIKDGATAKTISSVADGVVVGSYLVNKMAELQHEPASVIADGVGKLVAEIRTALDTH